MMRLILGYWLLEEENNNDIQIGYTFPSAMIQSLGMSNLRVYASVKNLATFHNFLEGWDPERTSMYPAVRDFMAGISVTF